MARFFPSPFFLAALLGAILVWLWFDKTPITMPDVTSSETASQDQAEVAVFDLPKGSSLAPERLFDMTQRPLFSETRRPAIYEPEPVFDEPPVEEFVEEVFEPEPEPFVEELPPPEPPRFAVQGFMSEEDGNRALLRNLDDNSQKWVQIGDVLSEWSVTNITPNEVYLTQGEVEFVVKLYE